MKEIVLNKSFGGFWLGKGFCKRYHCNKYAYDYDNSNKNLRMDERLVEWVRQHPEDNPDLKVCIIPDNVTDWQIHEYDGFESLIMVIDGKIVWG